MTQSSSLASHHHSDRHHQRYSERESEKAYAGKLFIGRRVSHLWFIQRLNPPVARFFFLISHQSLLQYLLLAHIDEAENKK